MLFKRGECIRFYTISGKIKVKINEDQPKIIGHNIDLTQHFGKATMQAIEEERDSQHEFIYIYICIYICIYMYIYNIYIYIYIIYI